MKRRARKSTSRAFTLIELMLVMGMMAILMAATGLALAQAMEQGRVSRTQAQIARIHGLLMTRYDTYRTRSIRIPSTFGVPQNARTLAIRRLNMLRQVIRFEMPERPNDIGILNAGVVDPPNPDPNPLYQLSAMPSISNSYRRLLTQNYQTRTSRGGNHFFLDLRNCESECLYLILSTIQDGDTNGLDFLLPSEIGDTDKDGMNEILDGWGTPIVFLRWAPGFVSPLQNHLDPDPFDPLKVDPSRTHPGTGQVIPNYQLVPLIFSSGPDGRLGLWTRKRNPGSTEILHDFSIPAQNQLAISNDPYCFPNPTSDLPGEDNYQFGQRYVGPDGLEVSDNITNHFLSNK